MTSASLVTLPSRTGAVHYIMVHLFVRSHMIPNPPLPIVRSFPTSLSPCASNQARDRPQMQPCFSQTSPMHPLSGGSRSPRRSSSGTYSFPPPFSLHQSSAPQTHHMHSIINIALLWPNGSLHCNFVARSSKKYIYMQRVGSRTWPCGLP